MLSIGGVLLGYHAIVDREHAGDATAADRNTIDFSSRMEF